MRQKIWKILVTVMALAITLTGAAHSAEAMSLFGYRIGLEGIQKESRVQAEVQEMAQEQFTEGEDAVDVHEALQYANNDKWATDFMKEFSGEDFCIMTESRIAYMHVNDDGSMGLLSEEPEKCHQVKAQEQAMTRLWERVQNQQRVSYDDVKSSVDLPWKVKMKAAVAAMRMGLRERFG